jgi:predicted HAD superfamily Cof-like phosphohydrolase
MSITLVREFHDAFSIPDATEPTVDDQSINQLRVRLLREELEELVVALVEEDPVATLDALTDLQYVLDGTYLQLGFAAMKQDALLEVHRTNLAKLGPDGRPVIDAMGKVQKPAGWTAPNLSAVIRRFRRGGQL